MIRKTRPGGAFFPYLNSLIYGLDKYGIFKAINRFIIHMIVFIWLYKQVVYHIFNYKNQYIFSEIGHFINVIYPMCNTLEINIEIISIRTDGKR